jgi:hypothetical protein
MRFGRRRGRPGTGQAGGLRFDQSTQLRFQEIDFALKASDVLALRTGCVLVAEPDHKDSNRKNNDEKEFHTQN